jgi:hypothetical protein
MATAYTSLLGLALPVTGELSGTWGNTVNTEITSLLDSAIAGTTTISSDADVTLTTTTGAANTAREAILLWTAGGTVTRNITAPAQSKAYFVINASSNTQSIVLRGAGPTTGVTIVQGEKAVCAWNGTDFVKVSSTQATALTGILGAANGGTGVANNAASTVTISGSFGTTLTVSGTTAVTLPTTGTLATLAGSETLTNKTLTNPTVTNYVESVVAIGNSSTAQTLLLTNGTVQTCTLTGNCTFTMPTAVAGKSFILILSTGAGSFTATFTSVKWPSGTAPTITTTASRWDILTFVSDGTNWYGNSAQAYA